MALSNQSTPPRSSLSKVITIAIEWEGQNDPAPELPPAADIGLAAGANAIISGLNGMVKAGIEGYQEYSEGKIDQKQYTYRVFYKGSEAAVKSGAKTVTALSLKEGVKAVSKRLGSETLKRFARSNLMTALAFGVVDQGADTYSWYQGKLSDVDYKINTVENVGSTGGAISGVAVGAMLGSAVPGIGTMLGGMMGMLGAMGGASLGKSLGETWFKEDKPEDTPPETEK